MRPITKQTVVRATCLALGALLVFSFLFWIGRERMRDERMSNAVMLERQSPQEFEIVTAKDVAYFEQAKGYLARPVDQGTYPGVVMIHENKGLNDGIRKTADQLARQGYIVLAVDLLGPAVETQEEARARTAVFDQASGMKNLRAAVAYLRGRGATKIGSLGWCFGGGQSLQLALSGEQMDATVLYYGRVATTTQALSPIHWPVLGIFGGADQSISLESVNQFSDALDALHVPYSMHVYPGVGHAFANPSGANYAPDETKDAWKNTTEFLQKHLKQ